MKVIKKIATVFLAVLCLMGCSTTVTAAEQTDTANGKTMRLINVEMTSEGITSITDTSGNSIARSSISGYDQSSVTSNDSAMLVYVDGSGVGGMGVTIRTTCSWNGTLRVHMFDNLGNIIFENKPVYSNGETYFENLTTVNPAYYVFNFKGIPQGVSVLAQVWIYG